MEGIKMIYTLTLNPSIDYVVHMDAFISGITNRTAAEEYYVGGKGINVSCILSRLGHTSTALGFTAGFTGREIENVLRQWGIHTDFVRLKEGISRINVKVKAECESEINAQGPPVSREEWEPITLSMVIPLFWRAVFRPPLCGTPMNVFSNACTTETCVWSWMPQDNC